MAKELNQKKVNELITNYSLNKNKSVTLRVIKYTYDNINKKCELLKENKFKKARKKDQVRNAHKANIYYLVTSFVDKYTVYEFMDLYNSRWEIEMPR